MGAVRDWLAREVIAERDYLRLEIQRQVEQIAELRNKKSDMEANYESVADQLATMTLRAIAAETKLQQRDKPVPLEPTTIKVGTAADVRRIMAEQARKDLEEQDG